MKPWTQEEDDYLRQHYDDTQMKDMMKKLGRSRCSIYNHARELQLYRRKSLYTWNTPPESSKATQFQKGHIPFNKGKALDEYCSAEAIGKIRKTQFRNGNKPHNEHQEGYECLRSDGYVYIKVASTGKPQYMMRLKHRVVWEAANGPVPKGFIIQFRDGDRSNCAIENLYIINRKDQLQENRRNGRKRIGKKQREYERMRQAALEPFRPSRTIEDMLKREQEIREASLDAWHNMRVNEKPQWSERPRI